MVFWRPFIYQSKTYDLSHLHPFEIEIVQEAVNGKPDRRYCIQVLFSMHCFTVKELSEDALRYSDSRETRRFCFDRYELSKRLPGIIRDIGNRKCFHTPHNNYFLVEVIQEDGNKTEYEIYFKLSRSGKKKLLNLFVESAYVRDQRYKVSKAKRRKPIRFVILARNVEEKRPIKVPK